MAHNLSSSSSSDSNSVSNASSDDLLGSMKDYQDRLRSRRHPNRPLIPRCETNYNKPSASAEETQPRGSQMYKNFIAETISKSPRPFQIDYGKIEPTKNKAKVKCSCGISEKGVQCQIHPNVNKAVQAFESQLDTQNLVRQGHRRNSLYDFNGNRRQLTPPPYFNETRSSTPPYFNEARMKLEQLLAASSTDFTQKQVRMFGKIYQRKPLQNQAVLTYCFPSTDDDHHRGPSGSEEGRRQCATLDLNRTTSQSQSQSVVAGPSKNVKQPHLNLDNTSKDLQYIKTPNAQPGYSFGSSTSDIPSTFYESASYESIPDAKTQKFIDDLVGRIRRQVNPKYNQAFPSTNEKIKPKLEHERTKTYEERYPDPGPMAQLPPKTLKIKKHLIKKKAQPPKTEPTNSDDPTPVRVLSKSVFKNYNPYLFLGDLKGKEERVAQILRDIKTKNQNNDFCQPSPTYSDSEVRVTSSSSLTKYYANANFKPKPWQATSEDSVIGGGTNITRKLAAIRYEKEKQENEFRARRERDLLQAKMTKVKSKVDKANQPKQPLPKQFVCNSVPADRYEPTSRSEICFASEDKTARWRFANAQWEKQLDDIEKIKLSRGYTYDFTKQVRDPGIVQTTMGWGRGENADKFSVYCGYNDNDGDDTGRGADDRKKDMTRLKKKFQTRVRAAGRNKSETKVVARKKSETKVRIGARKNIKKQDLRAVQDQDWNFNINTKPEKPVPKRKKYIPNTPYEERGLDPIVIWGKNYIVHPGHARPLLDPPIPRDPDHKPDWNSSTMYKPKRSY